jgi:hypothetical protein
MTYIAFVLRRAIVVATSAILGTGVLLCMLVVAALHTGPVNADLNKAYFLGAPPDENIFELLAPHHFHLRHGGQAVHAKFT